MAKNGPNCAVFVFISPETKNGLYILGWVAQMRTPMAPSPPTDPHFLWFQTLKIAQPDALTSVLVVTWGS